MATSLPPPTLPAAQVRQYSYRPFIKKNVYDIRQEFVGANIQSNRVSSVLSQQAPLVTKVHLLDVVRKVGKSERSKGKHLENFVYKAPSPNHERNMTSLLSSRSKSEGGSQQFSVMIEYSYSGIKPVDHISRKTNDIYTLNLSKDRKYKKEIKFKYPGSMNCDVMMSDVIVTGTNGDVTIRNVNKPIARKSYAPMKHSLAHLKRFHKSLLSMHSQTFTKMALIVAITITILGGMLNVTWPERKSVLGTSSRSSRSSELAKSRTHIRCHGYAEPEFARDVLAGKRFHAYIFPSADFWASRLYYFDTYIVNLESDHNFTIFYELIYLYIYIMFTVRGHPATGQHTQRLF